MRTSPIRELLAERGASFGRAAGREVPLEFEGPEAEYRAVREAVGLTDFSFTARHRVPEDGLDALEAYAAGAVASIRFGRVLHTLATDEKGEIETDLYVANDDENLVLIGESLVDDGAIAAALEKSGLGEAGCEDLSESTALFGIDGYAAWALVRDLFGPDVLGLPYLSIEVYELAGEEVRLIRAGKTSEFGYLLLVPASIASEAWLRLESAGERHGARPVGMRAHSMLRLDGRFFNVHEEGAAVRDPLPLGLQWMIDWEGEDFRGREALAERREAGLKRKIIGVIPEDSSAGLAAGDEIDHRGESIARVVTAVRSPTLGGSIGLALFDLDYAYSGLLLCCEDGRRIRTVSMPPFTPKSLTVKLDEM
jgi:glycine cleavage system aminomethyltransferase T